MPFSFATGVNVSLFAAMSVAVTTWFAVTDTPSRASDPANGSVTTLTFVSTSPVSESAKLKSPAWKVWATSSFVVTVEAEAVGGLLVLPLTAIFSESELEVQSPPESRVRE